ncbi:unnamed protein product [Cuscuta epithymum]|uniref:Uncharacterized protein n=1 Tax=Cuscuta epithymum TaxID=186058 RepID=A0AAV0F9V7_9ASTE|nr:unnamed protein product [Cuscuta epithymum]
MVLQSGITFRNAGKKNQPAKYSEEGSSRSIHLYDTVAVAGVGNPQPIPHIGGGRGNGRHFIDDNMRHAGYSTDAFKPVNSDQQSKEQCYGSSVDYQHGPSPHVQNGMNHPFTIAESNKLMSGGGIQILDGIIRYRTYKEEQIIKEHQIRCPNGYFHEKATDRTGDHEELIN